MSRESRVPREPHIPQKAPGKRQGKTVREGVAALARTGPVLTGLILTGLILTGLALAAQPLLPPGGTPAGAEMRQSQAAPPQPASMAPQPPRLGADPGAPLVAKESGEANVNGQTMPLSTVVTHDNGFMVPDNQGGMFWSKGVPRPQADPNYMEARELKLKVRELVDQLLATVPNDALMGYIALPTSFVNQDDFDESSSLGRYIAEQLFYEFNQRGFPVREYRLPGTLRPREGEGEFLLSRNVGVLPAREGWAVFVAGTYYRDKYSVFINARLIRAADGLVLRTAELVMPANGLLGRMLANTGRKLMGGSMNIGDFDRTTRK